MSGRFPEPRLEPALVVDTVREVGRFARRPYTRTAVLGSVGAVIAYVIGSQTAHVSAVVAAITALVSLRPTFHASAQEAVRQVLGVMIGALVSAGLYVAVGFTPLTFFATVFSAYVIAWLLRLGEDGAVTMGVTIILVLADFSTDAIENRLLGVVVGVAVAMVMSYFARPGKPTDRVLTDVLERSRQVSGLLLGISTDLVEHAGHLRPERTAGWLATSDSVVRSLVDIRVAAEDAVRGSKWSPWVRSADAREVLRQVMLVRRLALTIHAICRDLDDGARGATTLPPELSVALANGLTAAAVALEQQADTARVTPAGTLSDDSDAIRALRASRELVVRQMRTLDDTRPILLSGALLRDTEALGDIVTGD